MREGSVIEDWVYSFILTDREYYQHLAEVARSVGNVRFFEHLDRLIAARRRSQVASSGANGSKRDGKGAGQSDKKNSPSYPSSRTFPKRGKPQNARRTPRQAKPRIIAPAWRKYATSSAAGLPALVERIRQSEHRCDAPDCHKMVPWENALCPTCQIKAIMSARLTVCAPTLRFQIHSLHPLQFHWHLCGRSPVSSTPTGPSFLEARF